MLPTSRGHRGDTPSSELAEVLTRAGVCAAWDKLEAMQNHHVPVDRFVVSRMLAKTSVAGTGGRTTVYRAVRLTEIFIEQNPTETDDMLFNALIEKCSQLHDVDLLEWVRERMRSLQIAPSHVTLGTLVKAYGRVGDITRVLRVWEEMAEQRQEANEVTCGCMINACTQCGHMEKAMEVFQEMKQRGSHRNTVVYSMLMKGYGRQKNLLGALRLFREMRGEGVPYNTVSYNSIIDVCVKVSNIDTAEELLTQMTSERSIAEPDLITYSTMLKGYCQLGDLDKALLVMQTMKERGLKCDERVYNILLDGCVRADDLSTGNALFAEMAYIGLQPSTITHNILVRLYQRAVVRGSATEAVAQLYRAHGLPRPTFKGRSRKCTSPSNENGDSEFAPCSEGLANGVQHLRQPGPSIHGSVRGWNTGGSSSSSSTAVVRDYCYALSV